MHAAFLERTQFMTMHVAAPLSAILFAILLLGVPLSAQLPQVKSDPLRPAQGIQGEASCSTTEASSCAQAASKILPLVMGPSSM
jgi:hypothetical protein